MSRRPIACVVCGAVRHEVLLHALGNRDLDYIEEDHPVVACSDCGLVYLNPQHEDADYERYYRTADYRPINVAPEEFLKTHAYRRIQAAYLVDTLRALWPERSPSDLHALDVGCGPGALMAFLRESGLRVSGLESSPVAADYARQALGLDVVVGTVNDASVPLGSYDVAISTASIEHFTNPLLAIERLRALLKPGGLIYVNTPDIHGLVLKKGSGNCFKFVHTYYFSETSLSNLLRKAGFDIVRSWTMPPILKANFLHPGNYCSGELNIIAAKRETAALTPVVREPAERVRASIEAARRRDRVHALFRRAYQYRAAGLVRRFIARLWRPAPVFAEFFLADHGVDARIFPPLKALSSASRAS